MTGVGKNLCSMRGSDTVGTSIKRTGAAFFYVVLLVLLSFSIFKYLDGANGTPRVSSNFLLLCFGRVQSFRCAFVSYSVQFIWSYDCDLKNPRKADGGSKCEKGCSPKEVAAVCSKICVHLDSCVWLSFTCPE